MCSTSKRGGFYADRLYHQEAGCNSKDIRSEPEQVAGRNSTKRDEPDQEDNLIMLRRHDQFERSNKMTPCVWI